MLNSFQFDMQSAVVLFVIGVCFLAGGIANVIYATDNENLYSDHCSRYENAYSYSARTGETESLLPDICRDLFSVYASEIGCVVRWLVCIRSYGVGELHFTQENRKTMS